MNVPFETPDINQPFNAVSTGKKPNSKTKPFCIRLTKSEREYLSKKAGKRPLGSYIRSQLLNDQEQRRKVQRRPNPDDAKISQLLAVLGQSRLPQNLNQIAKAANMGALPVSQELITELHQACADIGYMRSELISALGLQDRRAP